MIPRRLRRRAVHVECPDCVKARRVADRCNEMSNSEWGLGEYVMGRADGLLMAAEMFRGEW